MHTCFYLHIGQVLEDKGLIKLGVEILAVNLCLILRFLVWEQVDLDEGVGEAGGPVGGRQVTRLDHLDRKKYNLVFPKMLQLEHLPSLSAPEL